MNDLNVPAAAPEAPITLTEFCVRHSTKERSVELLNAFFAIETHAARTLATETVFVERLADFAATPAV